MAVHHFGSNLTPLVFSFTAQRFGQLLDQRIKFLQRKLATVDEQLRSLRKDGAPDDEQVRVLLRAFQRPPEREMYNYGPQPHQAVSSQWVKSFIDLTSLSAQLSGEEKRLQLLVAFLLHLEQPVRLTERDLEYLTTESLSADRYEAAPPLVDVKHFARADRLGEG